MGSELSPELVERCVALVRRVASHMNEDMPRTVNLYQIKETCLEAEAIVAELPEPVDPDLIEAREMAEALGWVSGNRLEDLRTGRMDDFQGVKALLSAIKRGRELQKEDR